MSDEEDIDFKEISEKNGRTAEVNKRRWRILEKGLGGVGFGRKINVKDVAIKLKHEITTRAERFVPWT